MPNAKYDKKLSANYSSLIKQDPLKVYAQYPSTLHYLKNIKNKKILDIGCGDGLLPRMLAEKGAKVVAFDVSKEQIALAKKLSRGINIKYLVASPEKFKTAEKFDRAISTMVLIYARDLQEVKDFFTCAYNALKPGGILAADHKIQALQNNAAQKIKNNPA